MQSIGQDENKVRIFWQEIVIFIVLVGFAITYFILCTQFTYDEHIILTFLVILFIALLVLLFPWHKLPWNNLNSFKAGPSGVEVVFNKLENMGVTKVYDITDDEIPVRVDDIVIKNILKKHLKELDLLKGSTILWIDDKQRRLITQKRLLRALGVNISSAISSEEALCMLDHSNDYDLIITNINRNGIPTEGADFIEELRSTNDSDIENMPVLFYSGLSREESLKNTMSVRLILPASYVCFTTGDLLNAILDVLSQKSAESIKIESGKKVVWSQLSLSKTVKTNKNKLSEANDSVSIPKN